MVVLHYAGINKNKSSGVSVIVPQIVSAQASFASVGLFNYGTEHFDISSDVADFSDSKNDDYHFYREPFNKPDIVLFHSPFGILKSNRIIKMLRKEGIPYIIVPHGCFSKDAMRKKAFKKYVARLLILDRIVKNAECIQYLSEGEKRSSIYGKQSFIVPNGIEIGSIPDKQPSDLLRISFIGRKDIYHKGIDYLLDACKISKERIKNNLILSLYGPELNSGEIKKMISDRGLEGIVFDYPPVFDNDKINTLKNTDVFVLTSRFEGQPVAIIEAWAKGVPTLVTPGTNVAEECKENGCGWVVDENAESISEMLNYLLEHKHEIVDFSAKAYTYARETYAWDVIAERYKNEYNKITKNSESDW